MTDQKLYTYRKYDCNISFHCEFWKKDDLYPQIHKQMASPCVYLQLTGGNISTGKFIWSVVSTTISGENTKEEGAGLWQK